ncbi:MAG TPA: hypothetical protein VET88_03060 [Gammaproteobacteria bacterium]|nr:hypothetical protein [Gammaproteobacteria bacterium]
MNERHFRMRLHGEYQEPENSIAGLRVEIFAEDDWQVFDLNSGSAGFLIFVYAILTCQHMYLRLNCAERGLLLETAEGYIHVTTTEDWELSDLQLEFNARLRSGVPAQDDLDHVVGRMENCPVSRNLNYRASGHTRLVLLPAG